jgi:hypothetical protein
VISEKSVGSKRVMEQASMRNLVKQAYGMKELVSYTLFINKLRIIRRVCNEEINKFQKS